MLMLFVDNFNDHGMGSDWPKIDHSPWDGIHLADFVMPLFLFMVRAAAAAACWLPLLLPLPPPQLTAAPTVHGTVEGSDVLQLPSLARLRIPLQ